MSEGPPLAARVAVVTGAANGIGRAIALTLAEQGAAVAVLDVDPAGASVSAAITASGGRSRFVSVDVSDPVSVANMAAAVAMELGPVDILVNNAAIFPRSGFPEVSWDEWRHVIDVNLHGAFLCARALAPGMIERRSGRIVNVASSLGVTGGVNVAAYATTKAGLIGFTKCLARDLAPFGVTANVVVPGLSDTAMPRRGQSDEEIEAMIEQIPLKRLAQPREVAEFLAFIVGPSCDYVTGQTMFVNGGWVMP